jgi:hypothetical protein
LRLVVGELGRSTLSPHPPIYTQAASSKQQAASSKQQAASSKQQAYLFNCNSFLRSKYLYLPNKKTVYGSLCFFTSENIT